MIAKNANHANNFNLLRLILASVVTIAHVPALLWGKEYIDPLQHIFPTTSLGILAVNSFFIISGYLIVKSWLNCPRITPFLISRALRIYPGFIAACLICVFVLGFLYGGQDFRSNLDLKRFIKGLIKLSLSGVPSVFPNQHYESINGSLWSIPYEFVCYLFVCAAGLTRILHRAAWLLLFAICSLIHINAFNINLHTSHEVLTRCLMLFFAGGAFFLYQQEIAWRKDAAIASALACGLLLTLGSIGEIATAVLWGYSIIYFATYGEAIPSINRLPDVSYGVYLYSWPISKLAIHHLPTASLFILIPVIFTGALLAGFGSFVLIERPFMRLKTRFRYGGQRNIS